MSAMQAATIAAVAGLLCGTIIEAMLDVTLTEALFRILVLTVGSGMMATLLVWLHEGLERLSQDDESQRP